jgi:hypothetical protein
VSVYVFVGPTIGIDEASSELDATFLPPAAQGDVYRIASQGARALGIIDGYFENIPAVWHKEILWAMSQGVHVFGSASMGACRAAELHAFGMVGVGRIFERFLRGDLEDDDEVAVAHCPAEFGYRPTSVAMVNIRATLSAARACGVIGEETSKKLECIAKDLFFPNRSYELIINQAARAKLPALELSRFADWLPSGAVDQKRLDALAMLRTMRREMVADLKPKRIHFFFEHSWVWEQLVRESIDSNSNGANDQNEVPSNPA